MPACRHIRLSFHDDNRYKAKSHASIAGRAIAEYLSALRELLKAAEKREDLYSMLRNPIACAFTV